MPRAEKVRQQRQILFPRDQKQGGAFAVSVQIRLDHTLTNEDIAFLSQRNPGYQFERTAEGELVVSPTGGRSGRMSAEVLGQLHHWNRMTGKGVVFDSSTGFVLPDGSLRSPDASWAALQRWRAVPAEQREQFLPFCPDAVFEVRSLSDAKASLQSKMRLYLANGARLAVLVDAVTETAEVYRPGMEPLEYTQKQQILLDPELPGFVLDLDAVFSD